MRAASRRTSATVGCGKIVAVNSCAVIPCVTAIAAAAVCVLGGVLFMLYNEKKVYAKILKP